MGIARCREILLTGPHAEPKQEFLPEKKKFLESKCIDDYLRKKHEEYVEELEKHMKEKHCTSHRKSPEKFLTMYEKSLQVGVRDDDIIYITKIPYMAKKYLREKDPRRSGIMLATACGSVKP